MAVTGDGAKVVLVDMDYKTREWEQMTTLTCATSVSASSAGLGSLAYRTPHSVLS
jgi:hypothetical protein